MIRTVLGFRDAQANLISMAATARRQSARRGEAGLSYNAKTVVEVKKLNNIHRALITYLAL